VPTLPFGIVRGHEYRVQQLPLEAGDRLFFFTDGMLERNTSGVYIESMVATGVRCSRRRCGAPCERRVDLDEVDFDDELFGVAGSPQDRPQASDEFARFEGLVT
jgi:hypothetical protein